MTAIDWIIVTIYCGVLIAVAWAFHRQAAGSVDAYFVADRKLPWWIIGLSDTAAYTGGGQALLMVFFLGSFSGFWLMGWPCNAARSSLRPHTESRQRRGPAGKGRRMKSRRHHSYSSGWLRQRCTLPRRLRGPRNCWRNWCDVTLRPGCSACCWWHRSPDKWDRSRP